MGSMDTVITLRIPTRLVRRAEALIDPLEASGDLNMIGKVTTSTVLRESIIRGLDLLEEQYKPRRKRAPRVK